MCQYAHIHVNKIGRKDRKKTAISNAILPLATETRADWDPREAVSHPCTGRPLHDGQLRSPIITAL
jgi:hypothetical protein